MKVVADDDRSRLTGVNQNSYGKLGRGLVRTLVIEWHNHRGVDAGLFKQFELLVEIDKE